MSNKNEIDWSIPRKNINPKTKQPYKRGRNWTIVVYLDSSPEDWEDVIKQEPAVISPLQIKMLRKMEKEKNRITM